MRGSCCCFTLAAAVLALLFVDGARERVLGMAAAAAAVCAGGAGCGATGMALAAVATAALLLWPRARAPLAPAPPLPVVAGGKVPTMVLRDPAAPEVIQCVNPATLEFLGTVPVMSAGEVNAAVGRARAAQAAWATTSFDERRRVMWMLSRACLAYADDICRLSCMDSGKTSVEAMLGEVRPRAGAVACVSLHSRTHARTRLPQIMPTLEKIKWICAEGEAALARSDRSTSALTVHKLAWVEYHPLGVLGVIAPWNYPFHNMWNHVISGLFSGACRVCVRAVCGWDMM
jgi:hypothetical protein